jgi:heat shock protein HslJ
MHRTPLLVALVAILAVAACGSPVPTSSAPGDPTSTPSAPPSDPGQDPSTSTGMVDAIGDWQLEAATIDGQPLTLLADAPVTMTVAGTRISGRSACNEYGTELQLTDGEVRFGEWATTLMLCEDPVMTIEGAFTQAMQRVRTAERAGEGLVLRGDDVELRFVPRPAAAPAG